MNSSHSNDPPFLIVGQGIAGTLLAYFFMQSKIPFKVIDKQLPGSASCIAAGIINPITGRRMVKSWRFDELSSFAQMTYTRIEEMLGINVFHEKNILRALPTVFEQNEWDRRSSFPENKDFFCDEADLENFAGKITSANFGELKQSFKVDLPLLISSFRQFLTGKNLFRDEFFDFGEIEMDAGTVRYKGEFYKKIIFCEGSNALHNPYFNYLPFSLSKGELLLVKIKNLGAIKIFKDRIYIVPIGEDIYWIGSTNSFDYHSILPTIEQKVFLERTLSEILDLPFEVLSHQAGIRPTVSDKRPLLGKHPKHANLAIFNGLGTKGASLGPFFAEQMAAFLSGFSSLDPEIDIRRFV